MALTMKSSDVTVQVQPSQAEYNSIRADLGFSSADDISADDANGDGGSVAALGRPPSLDRDNQLSFIRMRLRKLNSELAVAEANGIHSAPIDASTGATSARLRGGSEEEEGEEEAGRAGRRRGGGGGGSLAGSATWCGLAIGGLALAFALGRARAAASA